MKTQKTLKTILFDLDGTLLPMDIDHFLKLYFSEMAKVFEGKMTQEVLVDIVMKSTGAMVKDTTSRTNKEVFMSTFEGIVGYDISPYQAIWDRFYDTTFTHVQASCKRSIEAIEAISILKEKGYQLVLATNPLFPKEAIIQRIRWAGLVPEDFDYITSFEENHYCKPQIKFYEEIMESLSLDPKECLMVGNDAQEDMVASKLGMDTYLVENHMLDRGTILYDITHRGDYKDFLKFVKEQL
jgi:FMN phosphatase YigB (HAD superfamily)